MLVPLTGPWARSGLLEKLGAEMAIDDINTAGGIKALGGARLTLMQFDAGESPDKAKNAVQRNDVTRFVSGLRALLLRQPALGDPATNGESGIEDIANIVADHLAH